MFYYLRKSNKQFQVASISIIRRRIAGVGIFIVFAFLIPQMYYTNTINSFWSLIQQVQYVFRFGEI